MPHWGIINIIILNNNKKKKTGKELVPRSREVVGARPGSGPLVPQGAGPALCPHSLVSCLQKRGVNGSCGGRRTSESHPGAQACPAVLSGAPLGVQA